MARKEPTFWILDRLTGWQTAKEDSRAAAQRVSVGQNIRLAANPCGPLALDSAAGDLGRLVLPRGMAFDSQNILYLLDEDKHEVRRFSPEKSRFEALPEIGGRGSDARQLNKPRNIATAGHNLYVADSGNRRVQVFDLRTLTLLHVWGPREKGDWLPYDVAAHGGAAYILDRRNGRVFRHKPGSDNLVQIVRAKGAEESWSRITVDREGHIYLLGSKALCITRDKKGKITSMRRRADKRDCSQETSLPEDHPFQPIEPPYLEIFDQHGNWIDFAADAGDVRHAFDPPAILLDHKNRFCLPKSLTLACNRRAPDSPPTVEVPLAGCPPRAKDGLVYDRLGNAVKVDLTEPPGPALYESNGIWLSAALDSQVYRCQWHRIELKLAQLPPASRVTVYTYTDQESKNGPPAEGQDFLWEKAYAAVGRMKEPGESGPEVDGRHEFLIQSRQGQYLWLKIKIEGDGYCTPAISSLRVHYPRDSYLKYLPAVYAADEDSRWFLERFLSVFQTDWDDLEQRINDIARYFDPKAVPAGEFMTYLADWLALPLEGDWTQEQRRRLLIAARKYYPRRGTLDGLTEFLQVYLHNIADVTPEEQRGYPQIIEGFKERQVLMLSKRDLARSGTGAPLWGASVVGRLQLDVNSREGEVKLISTGDPQRDLFHHYAHKFSVYVPSNWICTADAERMLRRAIDEEKPAHTEYELCLVESRLQIGLQSTVGIDTIVGAYPQARLACCADKGAPPSRVPRNRLGYDTVLASGQTDRPVLHPRQISRIRM